MSDAEQRRLERAALGGDPDALHQLRALWQREGSAPSYDVRRQLRCAAADCELDPHEWLESRLLQGPGRSALWVHSFSGLVAQQVRLLCAVCQGAESRWGPWEVGQLPASPEFSVTRAPRQPTVE